MMINKKIIRITMESTSIDPNSLWLSLTRSAIKQIEEGYENGFLRDDNDVISWETTLTKVFE